MGLADRWQPERGADAKWRWHAANSTQACGYAWRLRGIILFNAEYQGIQEVLAGYGMVFRQRQDGGCHRASRVDNGFQVRVVKVENMAADAIDERGVHDIEPLAPAEDAGLFWLGKGGQRGNGDFRGSCDDSCSACEVLRLVLLIG